MPSLSEEAASYIVSKYAELRSKEDTKTLPVTPRTLETMIRLTTAHAKCRLSRAAQLVDAVAACEVMDFALYNEVRSDVVEGADRAEPEAGSNEENDGSGVNVGSKRGAERGEEEEVGDKRPRETLVTENDLERGKRFRRLFKDVLRVRKLESCTMIELLPWLEDEQSKKGAKYKSWTEEECWALLEAWQEEDDEKGVIVERGIGAGGTIMSLD